ncbi:MAG: YlbF family regulator [Clostridiales Family XIII bacterium]|jgi:cell fate (sporulation/competence/biofilm development) regulator YlbF (YheA/YmcA/DUF963 family)|nr:YlbF family regulator [Clostridiales Family XIII bacterium]
MSIKDKARELSDAIKETAEYQNYLRVKEKAQQNPELVEILNDYQEKQFEIQKKVALGEDLTNDIQQQMQDLYQVLARDPLAAEYLQAQMQFALMANEVLQEVSAVLKV